MRPADQKREESELLDLAVRMCRILHQDPDALRMAAWLITKGDARYADVLHAVFPQIGWETDTACAGLAACIEDLWASRAIVEAGIDWGREVEVEVPFVDAK